MGDAIFKIPTPLMLEKIVTAMDEIYAQAEQLHDTDVRGDIYEYLLSKIATAGVNGQFRTPRHIIRMMVELTAPKADDVICDPACGTSGFLVSAGEYLKEHRKEEIFFTRQKKDHYMNHMFFGYDMDRTMLRIGAMNMMTHGIDNPFIEYRDSLSDQNPDKEKYSLILANPPFKGSLDADTVSADLLKVCKTKKTELLFLALFLRMLRIGGRCACIVPDGVLFGSSTAHKAIRKELVDGNRLEAVISMPSGVFKPYAGVSTAVLIFTKTGHGGTDNVWCHYRNRFGPHILAEQKIFMISQTAGLMIPPQIAQRLAFLQRSYRAFPIINIVHTISVSHTSAGETDKTGMKVRQSLCQIGAQPVLPAFKCILWEKRNHIQGILPSHLRTNGQHGIRSIRRCRQYSLLFFPLCR